MTAEQRTSLIKDLKEIKPFIPFIWSDEKIKDNPFSRIKAFIHDSILTPQGTGESEGNYKLIGHSHQIADTGDYDGCYEITDGKKFSIYTKDDHEETLNEVVLALNDSGCSFYTDDRGDEAESAWSIVSSLNKELDELRAEKQTEDESRYGENSVEAARKYHKENPILETEPNDWHLLDRVLQFAVSYASTLRTDCKCAEKDREIERLKRMIDEGLHWDDLKNNTKYPTEL